MIINSFIFLHKSWRIVTIFQLLTSLLYLLKRMSLRLDLLDFWNSYYILQGRKIDILSTHWLNFIDSKTISNWLMIHLWRNLFVLLSILYFHRNLWLFLSSNLLEIVIDFTFCSLPTWPLRIIGLYIKLLWLLHLRNHNFRNSDFFLRILYK